MKYLITGGSGYVGSELRNALLSHGHTCINIDLNLDNYQHPELIQYSGDISDVTILNNIFEKHAPFDGIFHVAAQLQLTRKNRALFYATNIQANALLAQKAVDYGAKQFIFISSNCVYGKMNSHSVHEETALKPFEEYGRTKVEAEKILLNFQDKLNVIILRPPTIIGKGRLGILSIVFDFIRENRKLWLVGSGQNSYQFIYTPDLIAACFAALNYNKSNIFNIGCDQVPTLNELFTQLILAANSQTKLYHLPSSIFLPAMKVCHYLGISPLGPYQYNMIANSFIGDTSKIKRELNWVPTQSNAEMLIENYHYYLENYDEIHQSTLTGHKKAGKAGILKLIKLVS